MREELVPHMIGVEEIILPKSRAKKPYAKPAIVYRQPLEAMASVCTGDGGKSPTDGCLLVYS